MIFGEIIAVKEKKQEFRCQYKTYDGEYEAALLFALRDRLKTLQPVGVFLLRSWRRMMYISL